MIIHSFKWPSFKEYQNMLLEVIALPYGAKGQLRYSERWVNESFANNYQNSKGKTGIFWILRVLKNIVDTKSTIEFNFGCPTVFSKF